MAFIHALNLVLYGLLVLTNLLLIPIIAMVGFRVGEDFAEQLTQNPDLLALLPVVAAFMAVGLVNGLLAMLILHNPPPVGGKGRSKPSSNPISVSVPKLTDPGDGAAGPNRATGKKKKVAKRKRV